MKRRAQAWRRYRFPEDRGDPLYLGYRAPGWRDSHWTQVTILGGWTLALLAVLWGATR